MRRTSGGHLGPNNEGRGRSPGNMCALVGRPTRIRPTLNRSTKAGTGDPANPGSATASPGTGNRAQRRPRPESRQILDLLEVAHGGDDLRSTKAETGIPANHLRAPVRRLVR